MKFLLDENVTPDTAAVVRAVYVEHEWVSAYDEPATYCGVDDLDLFPDLAERGFDAIVTQDKQQLRDITERAALVESHLHWIGFQMKDWPGLQGLALRSATLVAGLFYVLDDWRLEPHGYYLRGVEALPSQRMKVQTLNVGGQA